MAKSAPCSDLRKRLFIIDDKQVFFDAAGNCADASYTRVLFGATPQTVLCSSADTIAGPRTNCTDETLRNTFNTILANLDKDDLGLGPTHTVKAVPLLPDDGTTVAFKTVDATLYSGVSPTRNVVIKDAAAWSKFWDAHQAGRGKSEPIPDIDFSQQMVLGVFFKVPNNCSTVEILKLSIRAQKLLVEYRENEVVSIASCDPDSSLASTPMHLIVADRQDAPPEFSDISAAVVNFASIEQTANSAVQVAKNVVVQDEPGWAALWAEHTKGLVVAPPRPEVDFGKNMVIAVFMGEQPSPCYDTTIVNIWHSGSILNVLHADRAPRDNQRCMAGVVRPAHIVQVPRTKDTVEFVTGTALN